MLEREHSRRGKERNLLAVHDGLERGPHRHFGLAVANVSAQEAVHRRGRLHVLLYGGRRGGLIRRQFVREGLLELFLPVRVRAEGVTLHCLALRVQL